MNQRVSHEQKVLDPVQGDDHQATKRSPRDAVALPLQPDATTPPKGAGTTASTNELPRLGSILILDAEPGRGQPRRRCKHYQQQRWTNDEGEYASDGSLRFRTDNDSNNEFVYRVLTALMVLGAGRLGICY